MIWRKKYEANIKNVIAKKCFSVTNQIIAIERCEMKKLNTPTLDNIVDECYRFDGFSWIWCHANDFVGILATPGNTFARSMSVLCVTCYTGRMLHIKGSKAFDQSLVRSISWAMLLFIIRSAHDLKFLVAIFCEILQLNIN